MRIPQNMFRIDESKLIKDLDTSESFLLSSSNSITLVRKKEQIKMPPEYEQFESSSIVQRFYELDPD